jgi:enamine deaminase RidA (YjgF/YER057c/UK114 family)
MIGIKRLALITAAALVLGGGAVGAQSDTTYAKQAFQYSPWAAKLFADVVTVKNPGRMIFLSGMGSEDETTGKILFLGDFAAQCKYGFDKIKSALVKQHASMADVVKITTYVTDIRSLAATNKCRQDAFGDLPLPTHTLVAVSQLALPGMLVEIDATAMPSN